MKCEKMRRPAQLLSSVAVLAIGAAAAQTAERSQKNSAASGPSLLLASDTTGGSLAGLVFPDGRKYGDTGHGSGAFRP